MPQRFSTLTHGLERLIPIKAYFRLVQANYLKLTANSCVTRTRSHTAPPVRWCISGRRFHCTRHQGKFSAIDRASETPRPLGTATTIRLSALFPIRTTSWALPIRAVSGSSRQSAGALLTIPGQRGGQCSCRGPLMSSRCHRADNTRRMEIRSIKGGERVGSLGVVEDGCECGAKSVVEGVQSSATRQPG